MGRLKTATAKCNYKDIDRKLKEQFIHGLNSSDMVIKIIKEITKMGENEKMTSEQVQVLARRAKSQKAQSAILKHLNQTKDIDKISTRKGYKDKLRYNCENRPEWL